MSVLKKFHPVFAALFYLAGVSWALLVLTGSDLLAQLLHGGTVMEVVAVLVLVAALANLDDFIHQFHGRSK